MFVLDAGNASKSLIKTHSSGGKCGGTFSVLDHVGVIGSGLIRDCVLIVNPGLSHVHIILHGVDIMLFGCVDIVAVNGINNCPKA